MINGTWLNGDNGITWWRHQMETFSVLVALCAGNSPVTSEYPAQRPAPRSFEVVFDLRLNKRLSKQSWGWWFETPSCSLWRHCNEIWKHEWLYHLHCPWLWPNSCRPTQCHSDHVKVPYISLTGTWGISLLTLGRFQKRNLRTYVTD